MGLQKGFLARSNPPVSRHTPLGPGYTSRTSFVYTHGPGRTFIKAGVDSRFQGFMGTKKKLQEEGGGTPDPLLGLEGGGSRHPPLRFRKTLPPDRQHSIA